MNEAYKTKTPPEETEKREDGYIYAKRRWIVSEMNRLHPLRTEVVTFEEFEPKSFVYTCTVLVTDLITREARSGSGAHPVIAFEAGTETPKSLAKARQHINSAKKSALSKALRDAYKHFGIASDLHKIQMITKPTEEQRLRFESLIPPESEYVGFDPVLEQQMKEWINKKKQTFNSTLDQGSADKWLDDFSNDVQRMLKKGKSNG